MPTFPANKICLIRTSAIGDTVHALALINGLRRGYPDAHLTWVLQNIPYDMVKHQPNVDQFITFNRNADLTQWAGLLRRLKRQRFDLAIVPQASAKVSLITLFTRATIKLGFDWQRSRELHWLVTNRRIPSRPMQHVQDQFFEFLNFLGIEKSPPTWDFRFTDEERLWQRAFFEAIDRPVIGFVIASAHPEKDWSAQNYAQTIDYVERHFNCRAMIIGGPGRREQTIAEKIQQLCHCKPIVALEKPIRHTMLQLGGCRLVVAPDTGPLHIAVALGVPTIGLYGYSNPRRCGPYRFRDLLIDKYNAPGEENAPITRKVRPDRMALITPEAVIEKIALGLNKYPENASSEEQRR